MTDRAELDWAHVHAGVAERVRDYLDTVSAHPEIRRYKEATYDLVGAEPSAHILDVGCGTGDDVYAMSRRVMPGGSVTGVDNSEELIAAARTGTDEAVAFRAADIADLPFGVGEFDGVRADRVLMHVDEPVRAIAEMVRVLRGGGRLVVTEPDWDSLVVDGGNTDVGRRLLAAHFATVVRHPRIGRSLLRRFIEAGLREAAVADCKNTIVRDLGTADRMFGLAVAAERAARYLPGEADAVGRWRQALESADARGLFFCAVTGYTVVGRKPELGHIE